MGRVFAPFEVGQRFRVQPPNAAPSPDGRIDLFMAAGAFGSGEHETTADCLDRMEHLAAVNAARVLDVGSGTGILSIAAIKLGARSAVCLDIEAEAVRAAEQNCRLNGVAERASHVCGAIGEAPAGPFDLILANIYGDLLLAHVSDLVGRATPGGHLLVSGILWEDNFPVVSAYQRAGCRVVHNHWLAEYSTLILRAPTHA